MIKLSHILNIIVVYSSTYTLMCLHVSVNFPYLPSTRLSTQSKHTTKTTKGTPYTFQYTIKYKVINNYLPASLELLPAQQHVSSHQPAASLHLLPYSTPSHHFIAIATVANTTMPTTTTTAYISHSYFATLPKLGAMAVVAVA